MTWPGPEGRELARPLPSGLCNGARVVVRGLSVIPLLGTVVEVHQATGQVAVRLVIGRRLRTVPMAWCEVREEKRRSEKVCAQDGYDSVGEQFR